MGRNQASVCITLATTLRCSSVAPLDTPVVPPVYCRKATSSGPTGGRTSFRRVPSAMAMLKRVTLRPSVSGSVKAGTIFLTLRTTKLTSWPFQKPSRSPIETSTTCLTTVRSITSSSVAAKFSRTTITSAPESLSWNCSSRAV
ncbi:hypothetical protein Y694_04311 [Methylibium sp. T29-B]|nr:hypothetical protein Y694_04311 [Methylibium sp. T29-B]